jgi:hypothetical protein
MPRSPNTTAPPSGLLTSASKHSLSPSQSPARSFPATAILAIAARVDDGLVSLADVEITRRETECDLRGAAELCERYLRNRARGKSGARRRAFCFQIWVSLHIGQQLTLGLLHRRNDLHGKDISHRRDLRTHVHCERKTMHRCRAAGLGDGRLELGPRRAQTHEENRRCERDTLQISPPAETKGPSIRGAFLRVRPAGRTHCEVKVLWTADMVQAGQPARWVRRRSTCPRSFRDSGGRRCSVTSASCDGLRRVRSDRPRLLHRSIDALVAVFIASADHEVLARLRILTNNVLLLDDSTML